MLCLFIANDTATERACALPALPPKRRDASILMLMLEMRHLECALFQSSSSALTACFYQPLHEFLSIIKCRRRRRRTGRQSASRRHGAVARHFARSRRAARSPPAYSHGYFDISYYYRHLESASKHFRMMPTYCRPRLYHAPREIVDMRERRLAERRLRTTPRR